jgi:hypothetical protein
VSSAAGYEAVRKAETLYLSPKERICLWAGCQWLAPVILAIQEAEIRKIAV